MNLETFNQTNTKTRVTVVISFLTDFILMLAGIAFNFTFLIMPPTGIILLVLVVYIALSRRKSPANQKNIFVKIGFIIFIIITIDVIIFMQTSAYGWHPLLLLVAPLSYLFALYFRSAKFLQWDKLQCLIIPLFFTFIISMLGDAPLAKSTCQYIASQPRIKMLIDDSYGAFKVRYILQLKNSPQILLSYRKSIGASSDSPTLNCFNFKTKKMTAWLPAERSEVIGLYQYPVNEDIYVVTVNKASKHLDKKNISYMDFLIFNTQGKIKQQLAMPQGRAYAYSANIFLKDKLILIITDNQTYQYNPQTNKLKVIKGNTPIAYSTSLAGDYLYGAFAHSPLLFILFPYSIIKYNLKFNVVEKKFKRNIFGYYEIKKINSTTNFVASNLWIGGGIMLDVNLKVIKKVNIPRGVRNFALDPKGKYLFAPNFFTGYLYILDLLKNKILPQKYFVGKGARFVQALSDKKLLIANSCGLMELSPHF